MGEGTVIRLTAPRKAGHFEVHGGTSGSRDVRTPPVGSDPSPASRHDISSGAHTASGITDAAKGPAAAVKALRGARNRSYVAGRVCELFAGVGGFRLGLERSGWETVWSNQWEPRNAAQWASKCYVAHFGAEGHVNEDIAKVPASAVPAHDLLVGGFPCQDYSVATTLSKAAGIQGKKGVLWWEIYRILREKRPPFALLENVDRLLKSPAYQRGRDFGVMLWCLASLGYSVEWRVVNSADYGAPQKRRRVFILAARDDTDLGQAMAGCQDRQRWLHRDGFFASVFPVVPSRLGTLVPEPPHSRLDGDVRRVSDRFAFSFRNAGVMTGRDVWTSDVSPRKEPVVTLGSILQSGVGPEFFIPEKDIPIWRYLKGAKSEKRNARTGYEYRYTEGAIPFPDPLDQPSRTLITSEGGLNPSRFKHIILDPEVGKYRVLTPVECERLNQFPDNWTNTGMPMRWRYFCMGNALVVSLVERMGRRLAELAEADLARVGGAKPAARVSPLTVHP